MEYPILLYRDGDEWSEWLERYHATARGVWVRLAKKGSKLESVSRDDALDVALCYGWIDGQAKANDAESWLQKFTPRGKKSLWSKRNREHVERLIASGRMRPAGFAAIEAAKLDGRWERAYDSPASATVPEDFQAALDDHPEARQFFESLGSTRRFAILYRIQTAVKAETRARRIDHFIDMLERRETLNP
ncbi:MAG: bacteriocin-protection protein [Gemmatimonas sp.]|nr:bacteriocin-protection protein [Gemmatimonas sp.]